MREKIKFLLVLLCIGLCSGITRAEETSVESSTPTVGESYYLYNVATGKFLTTGNDYNMQATLAPYGLKLTIGGVSEGVYTITVASIQKKMYASDNRNVYLDYHEGDESRTYWSFIKQENGYYRIQCAENNAKYDASRFLSWDGEDDRAFLQETGTLDWAFLTKEAYEAIAYRLPTDKYEFPTIPATTLSSGSTYYLYNVDARQFLGRMKDNNSQLGLRYEPSPVEIVKLANGAYTIRFTDLEHGYIYSTDRNCNTNSNWYDATSEYSYWRIQDVGESIYMIQRSPLNTSYYNAVEYMGWQGDLSMWVEACHPQDFGAKWKLIPADETGDRIAAQFNLYNSLVETGKYTNYGWNTGYHDELYDKRNTADKDEMNTAAYSLRNGLKMSAGYKAPYWNERPILWECQEGQFGQNYHSTWCLPDNNNTSGTYFHRTMWWSAGTSSISATVDVAEPSVFIYSLNGYNGGNMKVYVDDVMVKDFFDDQYNCRPNSQLETRFFEDLTPGRHTIKWEIIGKADRSLDYYVTKAGVMASPLITVSLLEPGSLGTEVLYNTDHIKNVRRLKVKGELNSDDWSKIKMMHYLQDLDLSEAKITEIPEKQFSCESDTSSYFLHKMKLPEGLEKIKQYAYNYSLLDSLEIPSTVTAVGREAFSYSHIRKLDLPDNMTELYNDNYYGIFNNMYWLESLKCPKNLKYIPKNAFEYCYWLGETVLPDSLETIYSEAFYECHNMRIAALPENLTSIGERAFRGCYSQNPKFNNKLETIGYDAFSWNHAITSLTLPESVTSIANCAFRNCNGLEEITLSSPIWSIPDDIFEGCTKLNSLRLNSPTVAVHATNAGDYPVDANHISNVRLVVPEHLVTSYKLDSYWYNFKSVEGFGTEEIQDWRINNPLVLNRERLAGNPNIVIVGNYDRMPSLKINGDNAQQINDLYLWGNSKDYNSYAGQILSNCNNVTINGTVNTDLETQDRRWHFFCLPYDVKVSDITSGDSTAQMAIRYYDGANRAQNGAAGSWKNYSEDDVIPAGTGFIMQTNKFTWNRFPSHNETKQNVVATTEFVKTLAVNDSDIPSNKGWNLVGNPWQCFYNDHSLNFTAPITVWDSRNSTYTAYSITDDDYAIRPNEAFFVQCPDADNNTIGFPAQGRQLDNIIESQNAAKALFPVQSKRQLIDLTMGNGNTEDRTRIVINETASLAYDVNCDASKMMSMDNNAPQLYTLGEDGTQYAINERPADSGIVTMGYHAGEKGKYTITLNRCHADKVYLTDYETNETVDLTTSPYTFTTDAGTNNIRFAISFAYNDETGISAAEKADSELPKVYTIDGKYTGNSISGLKKGVYVVRQGTKSHKVTVK